MAYFLTASGGVPPELNVRCITPTWGGGKKTQARGAQGRGGVGILFVRRWGVQILLLLDDGRQTPPDYPHRFRLRRYSLGGRSRTNHFKKFAKANFLKWSRGGVWGGLPPGISVPRALPPRGGLGGLAPQESPLITCALPPQRPCLAPVPCPQFFFFVQIFSSEFFSSECFSSDVFSSVVGSSSVVRRSKNIFCNVLFEQSIPKFH